MAGWPRRQHFKLRIPLRPGMGLFLRTKRKAGKANFREEERRAGWLPDGVKGCKARG